MDTSRDHPLDQHPRTPTYAPSASLKPFCGLCELRTVCDRFMQALTLVNSSGVVGSVEPLSLCCTLQVVFCCGEKRSLAENHPELVVQAIAWAYEDERLSNG